MFANNLICYSSSRHMSYDECLVVTKNVSQRAMYAEANLHMGLPERFWSAAIYVRAVRTNDYALTACFLAGDKFSDKFMFVVYALYFRVYPNSHVKM